MSLRIAKLALDPTVGEGRNAVVVGAVSEESKIFGLYHILFLNG